MIRARGQLPTLLVIGAMKCGTTALHRLLDMHPQIRMADPKELNFFIGPDRPRTPDDHEWTRGNWWRGPDWYAAQFVEGTAARGESSPGYTSPDHPEAAARIAAVVPDVRLIYLVRDPIDRAVSQYRHHCADGVESRPMTEALLDPASQYIARSRYHERLVPYLTRFASDQILVVVQEHLRDAPARTLQRVFVHVGVDASFRHGTSAAPPAAPPAGTRAAEPLDATLQDRFAAAVCDDVAVLRALVGQPLPWRTC